MPSPFEVNAFALVTGASAGIGETFARRLAQQGFNLILVARRKEHLDSLAADLQGTHGCKARVLVADLSTEEGIERARQAILDTANLQLLVNNAGFGHQGKFWELEPEADEAVTRLNVLATVALTRAALRGMLERRRGSIINVSSVQGFYASPYMATYCATKAYVSNFTEALSEELRGTGVRVQVLCPGFTRTEFQRRAQIDVSRVPYFAWMTSQQVVDASLRALDRGQHLCVPGTLNKIFGLFRGAAARRIGRKVFAVGARPKLKL